MKSNVFCYSNQAEVLILQANVNIDLILVF